MSGKKKNDQNKFLKQRIQKINQVINKFEAEVEKAVNKFMKRGEQSSRVLRKNLDEVIEKISSSELYSIASEKTEEISKEVRRLADDIVAKVKKFDLRKTSPILKEVRDNVDQLVDKLQNLEIVEIAKGKAVDTRKRVLHVLKIPSQDEVDVLNKKIQGLEKKVKTLTQKAA